MKKLWIQIGLVVLLALGGFLLYFIPLVLMNIIFLATIEPDVSILVVKIAMTLSPILLGTSMVVIFSHKPLWFSMLPSLLICAVATLVAVFVPHPLGICCWHELDPFTGIGGWTGHSLFAFVAGSLTRYCMNKLKANNQIHPIAGKPGSG